MQHPAMVSGSYIARQLGVKNNAITMWRQRNVLPPELLPKWQIDNGTVYLVPVWEGRQVPLFIKWYKSKHEK